MNKDKSVMSVTQYCSPLKAATHIGELVETSWKPGLRTSCELVSN